MKTPAVLVGQGIGDSLGVPFETLGDKIHDGLATWDGSFQPCPRLGTEAGMFSDDTEMAIALSESLLACNGFNGADVAKHYLAWSLATPHGMGSTTRKAMENLRAGKQHFESGVKFEDLQAGSVGNGTAMRCSPLGVIFHRQSYSDRLNMLMAATEDAKITHDHQEAFAASCAVCCTVANAITGFKKGEDIIACAYNAAAGLSMPSLVREHIWMASQCMRDGMSPDLAIKELGRRGNAIQTVASAIFCAAFHYDNFEAAVTSAIRGGGDADTRGAIVGAIVGAQVGLEGIPQKYLEGLRQVHYLKYLDQKLLALRGPADSSQES